MINPYAPPLTASPKPTDDDPVAARAALEKAIEEFVSGQLSAFQFDQRLDRYRDSKDPLIRHVALEAWYFYDDCYDHFANLSKAEWDYFQRILLALRAGCDLQTVRSVRWSALQLVAAISLVTFLVIAVQIGWGQPLLVLSIPFGIISIAISLWPESEPIPSSAYENVIYPFATLSDLAKTYQSTTFRKTKFPRDRFRSPQQDSWLDQIRCLPFYLAWLTLAPLPLFIQCLPKTRSETRFVAPKLG